MKSVPPSADHVALMDGLKAAIKPFPNMPAQEILAVASQFVGNLIAAQDQRRFTPASIIALVSGNIEIGNAEAMRTLLKTEGSA